MNVCGTNASCLRIVVCPCRAVCVSACVCLWLCRPPFSSIVLRLEQLLQQTPEELSAEQQPQDAAVAAAASSSQRPQGEAGSSRQSNQQAERLAAPGLAVFAPQLAVAGVASPTAEAGDAGVTGDWTM